MNSDFRLSIGYFRHPKIQKLKRRLGGDGVLAHVQLLSFAAQERPTGALTNMDADDIAIACDYTGDINAFLAALSDLRLLDTGEGGVLELHDWADHNPWAVSAPQRKQKATDAANARWGKGGAVPDASPTPAPSTPSNAPVMPAAPTNDATSINEHCAEHQSALPVASNGNALFLSSPNPPSPSPPIPTTPNQPDPPTRVPEAGPPGTESPPGDPEADLDAGCVGVLETMIRFVPNRSEAAALLRRYGCEMVRWQVAAMDWRYENGRGDSITDPGSYLLTALQRQLPLPAAVNERREQEERLRKAERAQSEARQRATAEQVKRAGQERLEAVWEGLPPEEQQDVEREARERLCADQVVFRNRSKTKPETWTEASDARNALRTLRNAILVERGHVATGAGGES